MRVGSLCRSVTPAHRFGTAAVIGALALGCGGGGGGGTGPGGGATMSKAAPDGDNQAGRPLDVLTSPLRVKITDGGLPVVGTTVTWQVVTGGGSVSPTSVATDASGIATTTVTLGSSAGEMTIRASASGVSGSPVSFTALVAGATTTVTVGNNSFSPLVGAVTTGGIVTFAWATGSVNHNITPDGSNTIPATTGGNHDAPFSIDVTFPTAGIFAYHCTVHGSPGGGMHGAIRVVP